MMAPARTMLLSHLSDTLVWLNQNTCYWMPHHGITSVCVCVSLQFCHRPQAYMGDRTKEALETFADSLVPSSGQPHLRHGQLKAAPRTPGCNVAGEVAGQANGRHSRCV
jgi:hypothetical protein